MSNVEGMSELLANLSTLGGNIKEASRKGLERGAKKIQANAKLLAPVGKPVKVKSRTKTGKVRKHKNGEIIYKTISKGGQLRNSIKTKSNVIGNIVKAQVYTNLEYRALC